MKRKYRVGIIETSNGFVDVEAVVKRKLEKKRMTHGQMAMRLCAEI